MIDVRVSSVSKHYRVPANSGGTRWLFGLLPSRETFWALRDVSFEVRRGEALGIVGPNGAGKTTLIKLVSGITAPSAGEIEIAGRLASLVEVGAGFQPDLTGRENVFLNGAIMGMGYREIARKLPSIIEFSEIGGFLDAPVKQYSSGMFVRLGFAIAAHLDADILLLDEVLAVGDIAFQARCFARVEELRRAGKTVLLVSHDFAAIERICGRALLLNHGGIVSQGDPRQVVDAYLALAKVGSLAEAADSALSPVVATALTFGATDAGSVRTGEPFRCCISYVARKPLDDVLTRVSFNWPSGYLCTVLSSGSELRLECGPGQIEFDCPMLTMQRGLYSVDLCIERRGEILVSRPRCGLMHVSSGKIIEGDFYIAHSTRVRALPTVVSG
jgi:ABC-type polysaccharide/polyol phosphate transport system ATPase subunit